MSEPQLVRDVLPEVVWEVAVDRQIGRVIDEYVCGGRVFNPGPLLGEYMELRSLIGEDFADGHTQLLRDCGADAADGRGRKTGDLVVHHLRHHGLVNAQGDGDVPLRPEIQPLLPCVSCDAH